jgi:Polyketide cyclase / dehydrase and lipid transport
MSRVSAAIQVPGRASDAEALWYDPQRWPAWIDGFSHVVKLEGEWPEVGARAVWESRPGGRGRVVERVMAYEARTGQTLDVEDEKLRGTQRVAFAPGPDGVEVALELEYELKDRNPFTPLTDALFIRRALRESLKRSLLRFARERRGDIELLS